MSRSKRQNSLASAAKSVVEVLEDRRLLSAVTFDVTNTNDSGSGSLRQALINSNGTSGSAVNTIDFAIPTGDSGYKNGVYTISLNTALPAVKHPVDIDATSESGYAGTPVVVLDGTNTPTGSDGFQVNSAASHTTISGLAIDNFLDNAGVGGDGIYINGASNVTITSDYLGVNAAGKKAEPNYTGIQVSNGASNDTIGGAASSAGNLISGNNWDGVEIDGTQTTPDTKNILVEGNMIGTDYAGTKSIGNYYDGIQIDEGAQNNTIGGTSSGLGNLISGNDNGIAWGIQIDGSPGINTAGNVVEGNLIGTDVTGGKALPNSLGIGINFGAAKNTIGGTSSGAGNVISGNSAVGIYLNDSSDNNVIEANDIGTDITGTVAIPNGSSGVDLDNGSNNNMIGGTTAAARNIISGNAGDGVDILDSSSSNTVEGDYIGTDSSGAVALGNGSDGVYIANTADNNTIGGASNILGGASTGSQNVISGNAAWGVNISGASDNSIKGNFIGTNPGTTVSIPNAVGGVLVSDGGSDNTIGGSLLADGNLIADNGGAGVAIGSNIDDTGTVENSVRSNLIYNNAGLAIDLGDDGPTSNTPASNNNDPNNLQNYPVLSSAVATNSSVTISGTLNSVKSSSYYIDFYAVPVLGPGENAQGQIYLGNTAITTNGSGNATFKTKLNVSVPAGYYIAATATSTNYAPNGDTSEFSPPVLVTGGVVNTAPTITTQPQSQTVTAGTNVSFTAAATGTPTPTVQWEESVAGGAFNTIAGATSTTLSLGTVTIGENGDRFEAVFTNAAGSTPSSVATLTVTTSSAPGSITGSVSTAASSYNLTSLGTTDWAHWGRGGSYNNFDHDKNPAGGSSWISNVSRVGSGNFGAYTYSARDVSWTNGTPTSSDSGDDGYIYANDGIGAGYSFTVAASTTPHTVYIYLGGYGSSGTLTASLSDNSAPAYSTVISGTSNYTDVVAITFNASSANQKLTITWVKSANGTGGAGGSVDLDAAWLQ